MVERWIDAETCGSRFAAKEAGHDYAHHGWYFRVRRESDRRWVVQVRWGRRNKLRCCQKEKRTYVPEKLHRPLDPPKSRSSWLARVKQQRIKASWLEPRQAVAARRMRV